MVIIGVQPNELIRVESETEVTATVLYLSHTNRDWSKADVEVNLPSNTPHNDVKMMKLLELVVSRSFDTISLNLQHSFDTLTDCYDLISSLDGARYVHFFL